MTEYTKTEQFIIQHYGKIMKTKNFFTKPLRSIKNEDKFTCSLIAVFSFFVAFTNYNRKGYFDAGIWICIAFAIIYAIFAAYIEDRHLYYENKEKNRTI